MENIFWTAGSNNERHSEIDKVKNVVNKFGDIVDFKFFSDLSLNVKIEIQELRIDELFGNLSNIIGMDSFESLNSKSPKERTVYLNITFIKGTGDLYIEVPSVPG